MRAPVEGRLLRRGKSVGGGKRRSSVGKRLRTLWKDVRRYPGLAFFLCGYVAIFGLAWWFHFSTEPFEGLAEVAGVDSGRVVSGIGRELLSPRRGAVFGTDLLGQDVLTRVLRGAAETLSVALVGSALAVAFGFWLVALMGLVLGARGYAWLAAWFSGFGFVPVVLIAWWLSAALVPGFWSVVLVVAVSASVAVVQRFVRVFRDAEDAGHVVAARATGLGKIAIFRGEIFPFVKQHLVAYGAMLLPGAVLLETALSFVGFGLGASSADSWGRLIAEGRLLMFDAPWMLIVPGLVVAATVGWLSLTARSVRKVTRERDFLSLV